MDNQYIFNLAKEFHKHNIPSDIDDLSKYLNESDYKPNNINDVFYAFMHSLQNYQSMPNIIKFNQRKDEFKEVLYEFNPVEVTRLYTEDSLYEMFYERYRFSNRDSKRNVWRKYTKGILDTARFLSKFGSFDDFDTFINTFNFNEYSSAALPMILSKEIHGIGFALACDCLKELGYHQYPKPDVHLNDIFLDLGLSDGSDYDTFKAIIKMSNSVNETPYYIDKLFWLISSGKYYLDSIQIPGMKKELIEFIKENQKSMQHKRGIQ